jgi:hypothetical protein
MSSRPELAELHVADPPERWAALGFAVDADRCEIGGVLLRLGETGRGITAWSITNLTRTTEIDGLKTTPPPTSPKPHNTEHPNGATGIDHVVIVTPDFARSSSALAAAGLELRRIRDAGGFRQGFRRLGPAILELVEARQAPPGPARFWGLVVTVADLHALGDRLGDRLGEAHQAVQSGRQIATLRSAAGLTPKLAFMTAEAP